MKTPHQFPVSKKFYAEMRSRIHLALSAVGRLSLEADTFDLFDRYLIHGTEPDHGYSSTVMMIFSLLKPEIDKAISRSRSARERGRLRREATSRAKAEANVAEKAAAQAAIAGIISGLKFHLANANPSINSADSIDSAKIASPNQPIYKNSD